MGNAKQGSRCQRLPRLLPRVVKRDSKIATLALLAAGLVFAAASAITVLRAYERRSDPPVKVEITTDPFPWPFISLCLQDTLWEFDSIDFQAAVLDSACTVNKFVEDENGTSVLQVAPDGSTEFSCSTPERTNLTRSVGIVCVTYDTSGFFAQNELDDITIEFPFNATQKTGPGTSAFSKHMFGVISVPEGTEGSGTSMFLAFEENWVVVEPSVVVPLDGEDPEVVFAAQSTWAPVLNHTSPGFPNMQHFISVHVKNNSLKQTVVTEQDPSDVFVLIGVIAGFFSIAAGAFNFLFVTTSPDTLQAAWRVHHAEDGQKSELEEAASVSMHPMQSSATSSTNNLAAGAGAAGPVDGAAV